MFTGPQVLALGAVIVLLVLTLWSHIGEPRRILPGFWRGNQTFLDEAGLVDMYLKIEDTDPTWFCSPTFDSAILMSSEDGILCSQTVAIQASFGYAFTHQDSYEGTAYLTFEDPETAPWPATVTMVVSAGSLAIHDGEKLLALLVREHLDADC